MMFINLCEETVDTLWATALAISFFYSDTIMTKQQEWELIVDKSLSKLRDYISGMLYFNFVSCITR